MEHLDLAARQLAATLTPADLDDTLRQVTTTAVRVLPHVELASITVLHHEDGRLDTAAPTDDVLLTVDAEQYRLHEGPCFDAAAGEDVRVVTSDLRVDERFPRYGPVAAEHGIRSQLGLTLFASERSNGALNLYSSRVGAFDDRAAVHALFVTQAGLALRYAQEIDDLQQALRTRTVIGQATGRIMERYRLSDERAFALLKRLSSTQDQKLRDVAREIVAQPTPSGT